MGALVDRLTVTLQEAKDWLRMSRSYTSAIARVLPAPAPSTLFFVLIDGQRAEFDSGLTPTEASVATGLVGAISALSIAGLTVVDIGGRFTLNKATPFELYIGGGLDLDPTLPEDAVIVALKTVAIALADEYIGNPFAEVDCNGDVIAGTEIAIPEPVKTGVLQLLGSLYAESRLSAAKAGTSSGPLGVTGPIKKKVVGDTTVEYATGEDMLGDGATMRSEAAKIVGLPLMVTSILDLYRLAPGWRKPRPARAGYNPLGSMNGGNL